MTVYHYSVTKKDGKTLSLSEYEGKILLIMNTASKCGFTSQYKELQQLYENFNQVGFEILAFPCNQFANQEPGTNEEIQQFCQVNYGVTFPVFSKINVKGSAADPLFQYLSRHARGIGGTTAIKWNFTKFLIDRKGKVMKRYGPHVNPLKISDDLSCFI